MAAIHTGVRDNFAPPHAQSVESYWRERYSTTNVAMSPIGAPDGFPIDQAGNRLPGFFDSQAVSKELGSERTNFDGLAKAYDDRQSQIRENMGRANGPDKLRLGLLKKAETASFEAERASLLQHPNADALMTNSRLAFTALMDSDRQHNHPIVDPDRDLNVAKPSPQEQFNWLQREDQGQSRKAPQLLHGEHSEYSELVGVANILQTIPLHVPTETAPLAVRNAMRSEIQAIENAQKAVSKEQADAQKAVAEYLKSTAPRPFVPEPDAVRGQYSRGTLVEHGSKPYKDSKNGQPSPYAIVQDRDGVEHTSWGVDLPRALTEAGVKTGDVIALDFKGQQPAVITDPRTGEKKDVMRNTWSAVPHDFDQHEAVQRAKHEAAHPDTLRNVEASVNLWLSADTSNKAQYEPLVRASAIALDAPLADQAVALAKDLHADQVRQAEVPAIATPVEAKLDADTVNDAFNSIKIQGFLSGDKAVAYEMTFGNQVISGAAKWDAENKRIVGTPTLDAFTQGHAIEKAMGGMVAADDREYIQAALSGFLESKAERFHLQNGYEQAPEQVASQIGAQAVPNLSRFTNRLDERLAKREAEKAQGEAQGQGQASAGAQTLSPSVPSPVDVQTPVATVQAEAKQGAPAIQAPAVVAPSVPAAEPVEAVVGPVVVVAVVEAAVPGQAMAQVEAEALQVEAPKAEAAVFMAFKAPAIGAIDNKVKPLEINAGQRLDTQMSAHEATVKPVEAKADEIAAKMGIVGPAAQQAQRERLGISNVLQQQETAQIPGQRRRLGM